MADALIIDNGDGGELALYDPLVVDSLGGVSTDNGDIVPDNGIGTAVYFSLFEGSAWYNQLQADNERIDQPDRMAELITEPITLGYLAELEQASYSLLTWMIDQKVAQDIVTEASNPSVGVVELDITVTEPNSTENRFKLLWDQKEQERVQFYRNRGQ
jgi:phage gp46-like protein